MCLNCKLHGYDRDELDKQADERLRAQLGTRGFQSNEGGQYGCSECGEQFAGLGYFDKHRPLPASDDPCYYPATVGLSQDSAGVWFSQTKRDADHRPHSTLHRDDSKAVSA